MAVRGRMLTARTAQPIEDRGTSIAKYLRGLKKWRTPRIRTLRLSAKNGAFDRFWVVQDEVSWGEQDAPHVLGSASSH